MQARLAVVGLGYVGLPLVVEAARAGFKVTGVDRDRRTVAGLMAGASHIDDVSHTDVATLLELGFEATSDPAVLSTADIVVICVPTPLSVDGGPDLSAVKSVTQDIAQHASAGCLVVLESTTWPGTTEEVLLPVFEARGWIAGNDFYLAFSPERIDPGNPTFGIRNTPKVVGGVTSRCSDRAATFYRTFVDEVVVARGTREAEMAKLLENTYRHINIALVNEMAKFSHELDIDFWDVIRCAKTKPFGFQAFYPGPGVGGHCIPIDPNYLSYRVRARLGYPFRFVELGQEVNLSMPDYVARRVQDRLNDDSIAVRGANVLLLGVTYKADIADERESPARAVATRLMELGARVTYHDPLVTTWSVGSALIPRIESLDGALASCDIAVLLQAHSAYAGKLPGNARCLLDTRGSLEGIGVTRL